MPSIPRATLNDPDPQNQPDPGDRSGIPIQVQHLPVSIVSDPPPPATCISIVVDVDTRTEPTMAGRVRQPIDQKSLERYIEQNVPEIKVPVDLKQQFGFGQSNPTYQLTAADGQRYVLRKKPPGKLLSKAAHKVEREYRIIHALETTDVPVPRAYCLCEDDTVIGTPFYIMEFLDGRILEDAAMPGLGADERQALWHAAVDTLARLHRVRPADVGLASFGRATGFYDRQIQTWSTICASQAGAVDVETNEPVGDLPHFRDMIDFFKDARRQPRESGHADSRRLQDLTIFVFHKTEPAGDWESWILHGVTGRRQRAQGLLPGATPGLPDATQVVRWYADVSGYDPAAEFGWGMAFNVFRLSAVCQGIAARYARRQASSEKAKQYSETRAPLAEFAWELVETSRKGEGAVAKL
ncbi:acyl-CoA dehydrogenase family member 11 [Verticillium alfalfae VaMs.102]|uniref:Acyl-CoA dehydrogenase family member 11 n=1 Tax=Verticillium alfalfae (strain VaMs.102 / ATCC MYA-4576 / FGSC 10136) TaxID=526221 RepID=C9SLX1_VERA1|nr:acyl-CoA dehydrogenase family member 11 [Verticillium alfalfae VaMs.102]EEY19786.1 acyl-CoA dehydrogenase family member 11 [Verticillium alfalfae VaMs.102]